jgi:hypothetical protein
MVSLLVPLISCSNETSTSNTYSNLIPTKSSTQPTNRYSPIGPTPITLSTAKSVIPTTSIPISDIVYITKTGEKYHRSNCHYLSKSKISIERKDAVAKGYTPCSICNP